MVDWGLSDQKPCKRFEPLAETKGFLSLTSQSEFSLVVVELLECFEENATPVNMGHVRGRQGGSCFRFLHSIEKNVDSVVIAEPY